MCHQHGKLATLEKFLVQCWPWLLKSWNPWFIVKDLLTLLITSPNRSITHKLYKHHSPHYVTSLVPFLKMKKKRKRFSELVQNVLERVSLSRNNQVFRTENTVLGSAPPRRRFTWVLPAESIIAHVFANCQGIFSSLICRPLIHHA